MKDYAYSRHAARNFLALVVLVGGPTFLGGVIWPEYGAGVGAVVGVLLLGGAAAWRTWSQRRGAAWSGVGKRHGLRPLYSGDFPVLPLPGYEDSGNLLAGEFEGVRIIVGDRREQYVIYDSASSLGYGISGDPVVSDPITLETFVALHLSQASLEPFAIGKRRSLLPDNASTPAGALEPVLQSWVRRFPAWRVEGAGQWILVMRPNRVSSPEQLESVVVMAKELVVVLRECLRVGCNTDTECG